MSVWVFAGVCLWLALLITSPFKTIVVTLLLLIVVLLFGGTLVGLLVGLLA